MNCKTKILALIQLPPPVHGASIVNDLIRSGNLINKEFDIRYIDTSLESSLGRLGKFGFIKVWNFAKAYFRMIVKLLFWNPSMVYITPAPFGFPFLKDSLLVIPAKVMRKKIIIHLHGKGISHETAQKGIKRTFYNFIFRKAAVIHLSRTLIDDLKYLDQKFSTYILPNGIPAIESQLSGGSSAGEIRILYLSNFFRSKGSLELLKSALILLREGMKFKLTLAGGWPDESFKKELLSYYNSNEWNGCVDIAGPVYDEEKLKLLNKTDILVFPSMYRNECFPLVILEAMRSGIPVVASKEGAIEDMVINHETGLIFDSVTPDTIANALREMINNPQMRLEYGAKAKSIYLKNYKFKHFEEKFIDIINEVSGRDLT